MSETKSIPPSLIYVIENELMEFYAKNMGHFMDKFINTLNPPNPMTIQPDSPRKDLPYISLSTLGVESYELDFSSNASYVAPVRLFKALFDSKESLLKEVDKIILEKEKIIAETKEKISKENDEVAINKLQVVIKNNNVIIDYCNRDKQSIDLIEEELGRKSDFYKSVYSKNDVYAVPVFTKQLLVFNEEKEDYISISPTFSLILNKKIEGILSAILEKDKTFKVSKADGTMGGANPQNITTYKRQAGFKLFLKTPNFRDEKYRKIYQIAYNGFKVYINKDFIQAFVNSLKNYTNKPNVRNKELLQKVSQEFAAKNILLSNNINGFLCEAIVREMTYQRERNKDMVPSVSLANDVFLQVVSNDNLKDFLFNKVFNNVTDGVEHIWLFKNKKDKAELLSEDAFAKIKSKLISCISVSAEAEKIIKEAIKMEIEK